MTGVTLDTTAPAAQPATDRAKLAAAAKQFEAIFVRQMLSEARKASFGDPLLGSGAIDTFREMQDNRFAEIAAERGVFGLAQSIEAQLRGRIAPGPTPPAPGTPPPSARKP